VARAVTRPVADTSSTAVFDDRQVAWLDTFCEVPSEYVAVAVSVAVPPTLNDDEPPLIVTPVSVRVVCVPEGPVGLLPEHPATTVITPANTQTTDRDPAIAILLLEGSPDRAAGS